MEPSDLASNILGKLKAELSGDLNKIDAFFRARVENLCGLAVALGRERREGFLKDDDAAFEEELEYLRKGAHLLARDVTTMVLIEAEKAWNAVVSEIWDALNSIIGAASPLPVPIRPAP